MVPGRCELVCPLECSKCGWDSLDLSCFCALLCDKLALTCVSSVTMGHMDMSALRRMSAFVVVWQYHRQYPRQYHLMKYKSHCGLHDMFFFSSSGNWKWIPPTAPLITVLVWTVRRVWTRVFCSTPTTSQTPICTALSQKHPGIHWDHQKGGHNAIIDAHSSQVIVCWV